MRAGQFPERQVTSRHSSVNKMEKMGILREEFENQKRDKGSEN
jgi:hypothetical protein